MLRHIYHKFEVKRKGIHVKELMLNEKHVYFNNSCKSQPRKNSSFAIKNSKDYNSFEFLVTKGRVGDMVTI